MYRSRVNFNVQRASRHNSFARLSAGLTADLQNMFENPSRSVLTSGLEGYNNDWLGQYKGEGPIVVRPTTTKEVSRVLAYCYRHSLAVVPQGGNTGLVGGSVPVHDEIILSTALMNTIYNLDAESMVLDCQPGVVLAAAQGAAAAQNLVVPIDLGAKGSCALGGNVSTNAGGLNVVRYGSTRHNVLGLEVVLPREGGPVLNAQSYLRKDNTGYDTKQHFIGSEGTLGVITRLQLRLHPLPKEEAVLMLKLSCLSDVQEFFQLVQRELSEVVGAFELMDWESLVKTDTSVPFPTFREGEVIVLVQLLGGTQDGNAEKVNSILEQLKVKEEDSVFATSRVAMRDLWKIREELPVKLASRGRIYKFDLSAPINKFYDVMWFARELVRGEGEEGDLADIIVAGFGHYGDGNIHLNFVDVTRHHHEVLLKVVDSIYEYAAVQGNMSFSAEHGVGQEKLPQMARCKGTTVELQVMRQMKNLFDPKGILNPYKVLPES